MAGSKKCKFLWVSKSMAKQPQPQQFQESGGWFICLWFLNRKLTVPSWTLNLYELALTYSKFEFQGAAAWAAPKFLWVATKVVVHLLPRVSGAAATLNRIFSACLYLVLLPPYLAQHEFSIPWQLVLDINVLLSSQLPPPLLYPFFFFHILTNTKFKHVTSTYYHNDI